MNIQIEINGEPYTGKAYQANGGLVIHLPGVQSPHAPAFKALFQALPGETASGGFVEVGEWNGKAYPFEAQVDFCLGPDGRVWAQIGRLADLPQVNDIPTGVPARIVEQTPDGRIVTRLFWDCRCEEAFIHPATHSDCPACGARRAGSPLSSVDAVLLNALDWRLDEALVACVRQASADLWGFDFDIEPDEGPLVEQYENASRLHDDDWLEAAYEGAVSGWGDEF